MLRCSIRERAGRNINLEMPPMIPFLLGLSALVVANLVTDHQARREGFDELKGGIRLGS
jgi:hypothetical protein